MHTHVYVVCTPSVHAHGSETNLTLHLVLVMKSITDPGYHPGTLLSPPSTGVTGAFCNSRLSRVLAIQIWVLMFAQ